MKKICFVLLLTVITLSVSAQEIKQMEFVNQPIVDILFTLAQTTGKSIIADGTVTGRGSYYFQNTELESALEQFLPVYNLYLLKLDGVYYVSRIMVRFDKAGNSLTVLGKDIKPVLLVERIAGEIGRTILYDDLPGKQLTINAISLEVTAVLKMVIRRFGEYELEIHEDYYYIKKKQGNSITSRSEMPWTIKLKNGFYSIAAESIRLSVALAEVFRESGNEYLLMKRGDTVLENIFFSNKTLEELLRLLLEKSDSDYTVRKGIYYIFDISRNEIMKKFENVEYIKLKNIPVELLPTLFPSGLASSSVFKIDKENNAIILSGSFEEITPVREFIINLEAEYLGKKISKLDLSFLTVDELLKLLPARLQKLQVSRTGSPVSLIIEATEEQTDDFISFAHMIDRQSEGLAIHLKYIRAEDLIKNLPPSIEESDIVKSFDPNLVFFKGSKEKLEQFLLDLEYIDNPIPQIRYELLVVQYQESTNKEFGISVGNSIMDEGVQTSILGNLGNLLSLNLDIVSTFGYLFAIKLNAKLGNSEARIMVNTTLNGLTGEDISFQNTNTYRYRDMEIDPDTGEAKSTGVTREITSGLIIKINGWVSGDRMVTMNVNSTVSKRGADVSGSTGNPPPTSEKIISTHVRTSSGNPVVISGLLQQDKDLVVQQTPVLGSIPLLGWLFTSTVETVENTEMVIYIVPYIEYPDKEKLTEDKIFKKYFSMFFADKTIWN